MRPFVNNIINGLKFQIKYTYYSLRHWPIIIILYLFCICILGILEPVEVYFQKEIIAAITQKEGIFPFYLSIIGYFLVSVLFIFQGYASPIAQKIVGLKVAEWIEGKIYRNIQSVPLEYLDSAENQVKFDRANDATVHISSGPAILMYNISYVISLLIPTIQLIKYPFLLIAYYVMGLIVAINNTYQNQKSEELRKSIELDKRALQYFGTLLEHKDIMIETRVQGYNQYFYRKWEELTEILFQKQIKLKKRQVKESFGVLIFQQFIGIIPIAILYLLISEQKIDIATYTLVTGMGAIIIRYIEYLFNAFAKSSNCGIYTEDIEDVLNFEPSYQEQIDVSKNALVVDMQEVSFHYVDGKMVLDNINFQVHENETIALVGENGSGKTTLSLLALGLYKPKRGYVLVYGQDCSSMEADFRNIISPVFQDYTKYEFTVRENIGYGSIADINNDKRLLAAISSGGFEGVYNKRGMTLNTFLGKKYETNGEELSGGEWQRIAIGRGIFGNSKLIVLDEPTASLDPISEIKLFEHIKNSLKDRAVLIVSHRIGICKLADKVVFMKNGKISEMGSHEELYAMKGDYYNFFNEQSKWYMWRKPNEQSKAKYKSD